MLLIFGKKTNLPNFTLFLSSFLRSYRSFENVFVEYFRMYFCVFDIFRTKLQSERCFSFLLDEMDCSIFKFDRIITFIICVIWFFSFFECSTLYEMPRHQLFSLFEWKSKDKKRKCEWKKREWLNLLEDNWNDICLFLFWWTKGKCVSLLFHGVWNELFKWIFQFVSFSEIELWHPHVESEMSVSQLFISLLIWLSLQSNLNLKDVFCFRNWISEVVVIWVTWDENERRENLKEKQENRFWKSSCPFRGRAFLKKKNKTTRDNRQASSFLIPHLNAWAEARGGFGSAADVCCLKLQIDWI